MARVGLVSLASVWWHYPAAICAYNLLRSQFVLKPEDAQILNGLLGTEALLLTVFALLLWLKK